MRPPASTTHTATQSLTSYSTIAIQQSNPKNAEIYGEPNPSERFIEDVRENGVETPIIVVEDSHFTDDEEDMPVILSGHKRRYSADETGHEVPIGERRTYETPADELDALLRHNDYRDKSFSQRMGEADAIREVEERAAQERSGTRTDLAQNFAGGDSGETRDIIADRIGIGSGETYRKARKVWDAARDGHPIAKDLVAEIDTDDESIHGAYTTLRAAQEFSTTETISDLLDELVAENRLSVDDLRSLQRDSPDSVIGYLSSQHGIHPIADGTIPSYHFFDGTTEPLIVEHGEIPADSISDEYCISAFSIDGTVDYDPVDNR